MLSQSNLQSAKVRRGRVEINFNTRSAILYGLLLSANITVWIWAFLAFANRPVQMATAVLAYSLGLRHAIDADHIATIDNVTRKLMQEGQRPVGVGFFFALGHSSVVVIASIAVALTAHSLSDELAPYRAIAGVVGTAASALFLFMIAMANLIVLHGVYRTFRLARNGDVKSEEDIEEVLRQRGLLARVFRPLLSLVTRSWHLFPIGLLFAVGFETASEISLFGLSAQASGSVSSWSLLIYPSLFAAGMTLVDTVDGLLMLSAYSWAYRDPARKLRYNLSITALSVLVALAVGGIETLGLLEDHFQFEGLFWRAISDISENFGVLGYGIIGLFFVSWGASYVVYRLKRSHLWIPSAAGAAQTSEFAVHSAVRTRDAQAQGHGHVS